MRGKRCIALLAGAGLSVASAYSASAGASAFDPQRDALPKRAPVVAEFKLAQVNSDQKTWDEIKNSTDPEPFELFIAAFPDSANVPAARSRLHELRSKLTTAPVTQEEKSVVTKTLGLDLANLSDELRKRYKIKDTVKGVVITGVDAGSAAAKRGLNAGDVIVQANMKVYLEAVANAADVQKGIEQLKKDGRKTVLLLVADAKGDTRFVTLGLQ